MESIWVIYIMLLIYFWNSSRCGWAHTFSFVPMKIVFAFPFFPVLREFGRCGMFPFGLKDFVAFCMLLNPLSSYCSRLCNFWQLSSLAVSLFLSLSCGTVCPVVVRWHCLCRGWLIRLYGTSPVYRLTAGPPSLPLLCPPASYSAPRWQIRTLARPNIEARGVSPIPAALAVQSYWQGLHRSVNQPTATGDWVAEKDCHLANCCWHAPLYSLRWFISIECFWKEGGGDALLLYTVAESESNSRNSCFFSKRSHPTWRPCLQCLGSYASQHVYLRENF